MKVTDDQSIVMVIETEEWLENYHHDDKNYQKEEMKIKIREEIHDITLIMEESDILPYIVEHDYLGKELDHARSLYYLEERRETGSKERDTWKNEKCQ